ncbi:unnamed protein product [Pleuronectes platessa]|uniref:Uncharacterized protein n=1 Tax=Pleuronectes platessa TaxID=8262 RepID=A0A9N7UNY4_PLEPL|nr:unnamed protein product [Pleuronectes platessa]
MSSPFICRPKRRRGEIAGGEEEAEIDRFDPSQRVFPLRGFEKWRPSWNVFWKRHEEDQCRSLKDKTPPPTPPTTTEQAEPKSICLLQTSLSLGHVLPEPVSHGSNTPPHSHTPTTAPPSACLDGSPNFHFTSERLSSRPDASSLIVSASLWKSWMLTAPQRSYWLKLRVEKKRLPCLAVLHRRWHDAQLSEFQINPRVGLSPSLTFEPQGRQRTVLQRHGGERPSRGDATQPFQLTPQLLPTNN